MSNQKNSIHANLGARIKELRGNQKLSRKDLADVAKVQATSIAMYEGGERTPSVDVLLRIAKRLGTTTDYLLGASEQRDFFVDDEVEAAFKLFALLSPRDRRVVMAVIRALGSMQE